METLDHYRQIIQDILAEYSTHKPAYGDVVLEVILDRGDRCMVYLAPLPSCLRPRTLK